VKTTYTKHLAIILLPIFLFSNNLHSQNIDINLLKEINLNSNSKYDNFNICLTNTMAPISAISPIVLYSTGLILKDDNYKLHGIYMGQSVLFSIFTMMALKYSINRDRPYITYPEINRLSHSVSSSFPSGHTSTAFATATSLSISFPKWYIIAPSAIWASSIGYTRMRLGVHYPSDVLCGAIIGVGSTFLTHKINKWINQKKETIVK